MLAGMDAGSSNQHAGQDLRAARERLGISRARLAGLAGCSLSSLDRIEQGAVPRRSGVLRRATAILAELAATEDVSSPAGGPGSTQTTTDRPVEDASSA